MVTPSELKMVCRNQIKINGQEKDCFSASEKKYLLLIQSKTIIVQLKALCIGRESNPGRPRGRRAFYH